MKPILILLALTSFVFSQDTVNLTDLTGRTIAAKILKIEDDAVEILRTGDNKPFVIPLKNLQPSSRDEAVKIDAVINPRHVVVTNLIVKKVDGKFRYFFDIRNGTRDPYEGKVVITLLNTVPDLTNGTETFETPQAFASGHGFVRYVEAFTGPREIHNNASVERFSYVVYDKVGKVIRSDEGVISDKFETLD